MVVGGMELGDLRAYRGEKAVERVGYFFAVDDESAISAEFRDFV
jgi:hypothetical protein